MTVNKNFDVVIVGGSYSGLSAALALGRSLRSVLVIDGGNPCNKQTPHSHNFLTQDGKKPGEIAETAMGQVLKYDTVNFLKGLVIKVDKQPGSFEVETDSGDKFSARKILFATGLTDLMPSIKGFSESWGISILHCPYCHGFEVKDQVIGVLGNGGMGYDFFKFISNWSKKVILFTNGKSTLTQEQTDKILSRDFKIIEDEIVEVEQDEGYIQNIVLRNTGKQPVSAVFARIPFKQHTEIPAQLGCEISEQGLIKIDEFQKTTVAGIFAAGDNCSLFRGVSMAVAAGTKAGAVINKELIEEEF